jgi:hypothetical protein
MTWTWNTPVKTIKEELDKMEKEIDDLDAFRYFTSAELENILQVADIINIAIQGIKMKVSNQLKELQEDD